MRTHKTYNAEINGYRRSSVYDSHHRILTRRAAQPPLGMQRISAGMKRISANIITTATIASDIDSGVLDMHVFRILNEVREHIAQWLTDYNLEIPRNSLGGLHPPSFVFRTTRRPLV